MWCTSSVWLWLVFRVVSATKMLASIHKNSPADTGTDVIRPNVTNRLYVMAALNCVRMWNTVNMWTHSFLVCGKSVVACLPFCSASICTHLRAWCSPPAVWSTCHTRAASSPCRRSTMPSTPATRASRSTHRWPRTWALPDRPAVRALLCGTWPVSGACVCAWLKCWDGESCSCVMWAHCSNYLPRAGFKWRGVCALVFTKST